MSYKLSEKQYMNTIVYGPVGDMRENLAYLMKVSVDAVMTNTVSELLNMTRGSLQQRAERRLTLSRPM